MDVLYTLEIISVIMIIVFYATSFTLTIRQEAVRGRVIQYAYYHVYDRFKLNIRHTKNKIGSWSRWIYHNFVPDTYVMVDQPPLTEKVIRDNDSTNTIFVVDDRPMVEDLDLDEEPEIYHVHPKRRNSNPLPKIDHWVLVEKRGFSAPSKCYLDDYCLVADGSND